MTCRVQLKFVILLLNEEYDIDDDDMTGELGYNLGTLHPSQPPQNLAETRPVVPCGLRS